MTTIPFNGSVCRLQLGSVTGDRIKAQGNFYTDHTVAEISWLPDSKILDDGTVVKEGKVAMEVEMRINLISSNCPSTKAPVIRYKIEYGHGDSTITLPPQILVGSLPLPPPLGAVTDATLANCLFLLPLRGRVMRLSARQIKIKIGIAGTNDNTAWVSPQALLQISFNPCSGMHIPISSIEERMIDTFSVDPMKVAIFPPEASEFRIRQEDGIAWPAATASIISVGGNGYLIDGGGVDANSYADWTPIPALAQFWAVGSVPAGKTVIAQYRQ